MEEALSRTISVASGSLKCEFARDSICERFHRTVKEEFYEITFRKNLYTELEALQADLDAWVESYNNERCHQGKMCCGRTPMQTLHDGRELWEAKVSGLN